MQFRPDIRLVLPLSLLLVTCSSDSVLGPTGAALRRLQPAAANGPIAFTSHRDGNAEIYVMNADGSGPTNLTNNAAFDVDPAWSPDGSKIAFASDRDGNREIYVMNADGSGPTNLTNHAAFDAEPAWSPDGSQIAFQSLRDGNFEIYVMNADGTGPTNLTNDATGDFEPAWSPDGTKIAFSGTRDGNDEIYVMNVDGSGQTNLTNNVSIDAEPAWSPDGTMIAFHSNRDGNFEIYVMNADGSGPTNLTNHASVNFEPAWSPDGSKIAFISDRDGNNEIYVMNANGSGPTNLTNHAAADFEPDWGPAPDCPDGPDLDGDGTPDACEESHGTASGDGTITHEPSSDRPGTRSTFSFFMTADNSPPSGEIVYKSLGSSKSTSDDLEFRGGGAEGTIDYLEVDLETDPLSAPLEIGGPGTIYAAGTGELNGESGWHFCFVGQDRAPRGKQGKTGDRLEIKLWDEDGSCSSPDHRFKGPVTAGDVEAESESGIQVSSARFKTDIVELLPAGATILGLRPVTFRYLAEYGDTDVVHVGLIAEEVVALYPEAVARGIDGHPYAIRYGTLNARLVAELASRSRVALVEAVTRIAERF